MTLGDPCLFWLKCVYTLMAKSNESRPLYPLPIYYVVGIARVSETALLISKILSERGMGLVVRLSQ